MRELVRRVLYLLRHRQHDAELTEELAAHRLLAEDALRENGVADTAVAAGARRALGNELSARERARDVWIWPWLQDITQDVRFALRLLRKDRGLALTAIVVLGLGAGINTAMFAIFNGYCIAGLPFPYADRVIFVSTLDVRQQDRGVSYADAEDLRESGLAGVNGLAAYAGESASLGDEGRAPDRAFRIFISANAFSLLGVGPMLGREFRAEDDRVGAEPVVTLAASLWRARYAADPAVIGRTVTLNRVPATVIGVMPDGFRFPNRAELWQPLSTMAGISEQPRDARTLGAFARLADGVSAAQAGAELEAASARLARLYPTTNDGIRSAVVPINYRFSADMTHPAWIAFVTIGFLILLLACANIANLLLTRSVTRAREMAIRASLGATRPRVVRQLLVESGVLAVLGSVLGLAIAATLLPLFASLVPDVAIPASGFRLDGLVLLVFSGALALTVFVFGLAPALMASRTDVNRALKDGGRGSSSGPSARRWTAAFLAIELAVTVLLLMQLGASERRSETLRRADELIDPRPLLTASLTLPAERYTTIEARTAFHDRLEEQLTALPGVVAVAVTTALPLGGLAQQQMELAAAPLADNDPVPATGAVTVGARYFETLGLPLLRGRAFTARDGAAGSESVIVNERFVEMHFPHSDPLGQRLRLRRDKSSPFSPWLTIVGVSPTVRQRSLPDLEPIAYLPFRTAAPATAAVVLRSTGAPGLLAASMREVVRGLDSDLPLYRVMSMESAIADATWNGRVGGMIIRLLTLIALILSVVGLYAVTAHGVAQRTTEIGVRVALGARAGQVRALVLRRAAAQAALGLTLGIAGTFAWTRLLGSDGTAIGMDLAVLAMVVLVIAAVVLVASLVPVTRATRADPVQALRRE